MSKNILCFATQLLSISLIKASVLQHKHVRKLLHTNSPGQGSCVYIFYFIYEAASSLKFLKLQMNASPYPKRLRMVLLCFGCLLMDT